MALLVPSPDFAMFHFSFEYWLELSSILRWWGGMRRELSFSAQKKSRLDQFALTKGFSNHCENYPRPPSQQQCFMSKLKQL